MHATLQKVFKNHIGRKEILDNLLSRRTITIIKFGPQIQGRKMSSNTSLVGPRVYVSYVRTTLGFIYF